MGRTVNGTDPSLFSQAWKTCGEFVEGAGRIAGSAQGRAAICMLVASALQKLAGAIPFNRQPTPTGPKFDSLTGRVARVEDTLGQVVETLGGFYAHFNGTCPITRP